MRSTTVLTEKEEIFHFLEEWIRFVTLFPYSGMRFESFAQFIYKASPNENFDSCEHMARYAANATACVFYAERLGWNNEAGAWLDWNEDNKSIQLSWDGQYTPGRSIKVKYYKSQEALVVQFETGNENPSTLFKGQFGDFYEPETLETA
jgi:hypothetical protein